MPIRKTDDCPRCAVAIGPLFMTFQTGVALEYDAISLHDKTDRSSFQVLERQHVRHTTESLLGYACKTILEDQSLTLGQRRRQDSGTEPLPRCNSSGWPDSS